MNQLPPEPGARPATRIGMIVRLVKSNPPGGPWLLYAEAPGSAVDFIDPTPELEAAMPEHSGTFQAEKKHVGWHIKSRGPH